MLVRCERHHDVHVYARRGQATARPENSVLLSLNQDASPVAVDGRPVASSTEHETRGQRSTRNVAQTRRSSPAPIPSSRRYRSTSWRTKLEDPPRGAQQALIAGFTKELAWRGDAPTFLQRNTPYSQTDLLTLLTSMQAPLAAVPAAALAHQATLKARAKVQPDAVSLVEDVTAALKGSAWVHERRAGLAVLSAASVRKTPTTPLTAEAEGGEGGEAVSRARSAQVSWGRSRSRPIHGTSSPAAPARRMRPAPAPATAARDFRAKGP